MFASSKPITVSCRTCRGRFRPRRGLYLERHHIWCSRSQRRFHSRRSQWASPSATRPLPHFAQDLDFAKLDVTTFSWQKVLGGEGGHGVIILSPRARRASDDLCSRLAAAEDFPHDVRGKLIEGIFTGETINTPSMLCVEDYIDALLWAKNLGGLKALIARADANAKVIFDFVAENNWIANLALPMKRAPTPPSASRSSARMLQPLMLAPRPISPGHGCPSRKGKRGD